MRRVIPLAAIAFLFSATVARAGGTSWEFFVTSVDERPGHEFRILLRPASRGAGFPAQCEAVVLDVRHSSLWWATFGGGTVTRAENQRAREVLRSAQEAAKPILVGSMGYGMGATEDPCRVRSRGLKVMNEAADVEAVYSFYEWKEGPSHEFFGAIALVVLALGLLFFLMARRRKRRSAG